jgi:radical SAM protein with 4Fe4S-binding SPASM domain
MMNYSNSNFLLKIKKVISFSRKKLTHYLGPLVNINDIITKFSDKPISIGFEVTNICNANCIFCAYQYLQRPKTILAMNLFKKTIDEFDAFGGGGIGFTPVSGEALIDPNFIERIKYARSKKNISRIGFFTNGILINQIGARSIITSGVDEITVSIPGFDAQTYLRIFRTDGWADMYQGLVNLLQENELCNHRVKISIGLRSDIPLGRLLKAPAYKRISKFKFDLQYNFHYDSWSGRIKQEKLSKAMHLRKTPKKVEPCSLLFTSPMILSNGDMTLCGCRDLNGDSELILGNIKDKSILEMWHDRRVKSIRNGFYSRNYPKICQDCSFYNDLSYFREEKIKNFFRKLLCR